MSVLKMMQLMGIFICVIVLIAHLCCVCLSFVKVQKVIVSFSPCVYMCVTVHRNILCFCFIIDTVVHEFLFKNLESSRIEFSFSVSNYKL